MLPSGKNVEIIEVQVSDGMAGVRKLLSAPNTKEISG